MRRIRNRRRWVGVFLLAAALPAGAGLAQAAPSQAPDAALAACGLAWGHNGGIAGFRTWALGRKDGSRQVVVLANLGEDSLGRKGDEAMLRALELGLCS